MSAPEYCFLSIDWWPLCMTKAEWSGWVQAIGSVLAIIAGAVAVWWQARKSRVATLELRRADDERKLCLIAIANLGCIQALKVARQEVADFQKLRRTVDGFQAQCSILADVPLLEVPDDWVALTKGRAVQERDRLPERIANATSPGARERVIDLALREFLECERATGAALAKIKSRLPYGKVVNSAGTVLHEPPVRFDLQER